MAVAELGSIPFLQFNSNSDKGNSTPIPILVPNPYGNSIPIPIPMMAIPLNSIKHRRHSVPCDRRILAYFIWPIIPD